MPNGLKNSPQLCEACLTSPVRREIEGEWKDRPFRLCDACAERLENFALRPLEWYRLAALHGPLTYFLHDDFYDQDGVADQNTTPVTSATAFPAPQLHMVKDHVPALLDYALTRWWLDDDVVAALKAHPECAVLRQVSSLAKARPIPWVESRCYEIAARALGAAAGAWIRGRWEHGTRPETLHSFLEAAAKCLPADEALPQALAAVERAQDRDQSVHALALIDFASPRVLDWIESRVKSPVSERWGYVAAFSAFSWEVAERWFDSGRPLNLVALDALATIFCPPSASTKRRPNPRLVGGPAPGVILDKLEDHALIDPVPRVTRIVDRLREAFGRG